MPTFPDFKNLTLSDATAIYAATNQYPPYSDFNFLSLWSWDTAAERQYSILNGNLVIKFTDYATNEPFLSFLGANRACETADTLLEYSKTHGLPHELRLIPEPTAEALRSCYLVTEDETNHDYLFSTAEISELSGNKYKNKRQLANKFETMYPRALITEEDASSELAQLRVFELLKSWTELKIAEEKDLDILNEQAAIIRALKAADKNHGLMLTTASLNEETIAFSIDEILPNNYAISHFFKTNHQFSGISEYFNKNLAKSLCDKGVATWNWEQDLGLESLRSVKQSYRPVGCLRKYVITGLLTA